MLECVLKFKIFVNNNNSRREGMGYALIREGEQTSKRLPMYEVSIIN